MARTTKPQKIYRWKEQGLIGDYEKIYQRYLNTTHCDLCNVELSNKKYMEHNHENGQFRNIVCNMCNCNKSDNKKRKDNTSGYKNVFYDNSGNRWVYSKIFKGKRIFKVRKNKIEILCIKFAGLLLYKY